MFAFEHGGIVPDIVTMAKGITSSYIPLGAMGVSDRIAQHFKKNVFWGGHTYNAHPFALATALANIQVIEEEKLVENARKLEPVMQAEMARLQAKHPSMKAGRAIGLFGMIDLQKNSKGDPFAEYNKSSPVMAKLGRALRDNGLYTMMRWSNFTCIPPLVINEEELHYGFAIVDECLNVTDAAFEG
jgi:taurine--2-oxoglutarate transaminase